MKYCSFRDHRCGVIHISGSAQLYCCSFPASYLERGERVEPTRRQFSCFSFLPSLLLLSMDQSLGTIKEGRWRQWKRKRRCHSFFKIRKITHDRFSSERYFWNFFFYVLSFPSWVESTWCKMNETISVSKCRKLRDFKLLCFLFFRDYFSFDCT